MNKILTDSELVKFKKEAKKHSATELFMLPVGSRIYPESENGFKLELLLEDKAVVTRFYDAKEAAKKVAKEYIMSGFKKVIV